MTSGIQDSHKAPPQIMSGDEEEAWGETPEFIEPDAEKFWDDNLYQLIKEKNLKTSKELYKLSLDELKEISKNSSGFTHCRR